MEDLVQEFVAESQEGLDQMERCLTELEATPDAPELLAAIFRAVHSIKGATGFLGFARLEALAHAGESLLGKLRDGRLRANSTIITGLLELLDGLRSVLTVIDKTGREGVRDCDDHSALIAMLKRMADEEGNTEAVPEQAAKQVAETPAEKIETSVEAVLERQVEAATQSESAAEDPVSPKVAEQKATAAGSVEAPATESTAPTGGGDAAGGDRTLRVDVEVLNRMMNLVGELVLTRNQILQTSLDAQGFAQLGRRLNAVTAELRETVMQARMQPVGTVFSKFPRLVRDVSKALGKKVRIEFAGQETGLDKNLLRAINDPLTHAVRNAVDHGVEMPAARLKAGKAEEGVLRLRAFQQSGSVVIELTDDGAGIPAQRVRAKAVERRLVSAERAAAMSDSEVVQMVFLPGFSTAEAVTNISGRGVGMDVVRSNVEKVGGTVELETSPGNGTTLRLRVPLTLAIVPALVVISGGQSFAVPQSALIELVYVGRDEVEGAIEHVGDAELYRLRGRLLPIVRLDRLLKIEATATDEPQGKGFYVAVVEVDGSRFGLVLDDLMAPEEIVVKPLSPVLREIGLFSGATVLGNGALALILDIAATASRAGISGVGQQRAQEVRSEETRSEAVVEETLGGSFLVFEGSATAREEKMAMPLEQVERIESVALEAVEYVAGRPVLQYRGEPLLLEDTAGVLRSVASDRRVTVLICTREGTKSGEMRRKGLVVAEVSHVASGTALRSDAEAFGGELALVDGKVTMVEDVFAAGRSLEWSGMEEVA